MVDFEYSDSLMKIIEEEKKKHQIPYGYSGKIDAEKLANCVEPVTEEIRKIANQIEKDCELYLICEMARKWVEDQRPKEVLYQAMIPINPTTKKNHQQILINQKTKRPFVAQSATYKEYEKESGWFLKSLRTPIAEPVNVRCIFYRDSARRVDLTNLLEAIDDILVKYRILADDNYNIIVAHDGSRVMIDREKPRTEIEITRITDYNLIKEERHGK